LRWKAMRSPSCWFFVRRLRVDGCEVCLATKTPGHEAAQMDWSIHVSNAAEVAGSLSALESAVFDPGPKLAPVVELTWRLIDEYFGPPSFSRCVFGNEFCEHLIPQPGQLSKVRDAARAQQLRLTLLTPYVSDSGISTLRPLFECLSETAEGCEVVFNDWGVLNLLRREYPQLTPVQGRLMNKSLRDPRVTGVYAESDAPAPALVSLRRSNLDCASYTQFLSELGVE